MDTQDKSASHTETPIEGYCRNCGRSILQGHGRQWQGALHCIECMTKLAQQPSAPPALDVGRPEPSASAQSLRGNPQRTPESRAMTDRPSAVLAFILGLVPGVGAVYNGQYAKAVVHVVIFGGIITLLASGAADGFEALFVLLAILVFFYMPLEAYRTARAIERGQPVDELSGLLAPGSAAGRSPAVGIVLIVMGVVFLLQSLGYWRIGDILPYWPLTLIALGIYLLYRRITEEQQQEISRTPRPDVPRDPGARDAPRGTSDTPPAKPRATSFPERPDPDSPAAPNRTEGQAPGQGEDPQRI